MEFSYTYDPENKLVNTVAPDKITLERIDAHIRKLIQDPEIKPGYIEVIDFENVFEFDLKYEQVDVFIEHRKNMVFKGNIGFVLYAPTDLTFGTMKMMKLALEPKDERINDTLKIVRSRDDIESSIQSIRDKHSSK